jgi:voltage-gated potassium channel
MAEGPEVGGFQRRFNRRVEKRGLRLRFAAYVIISSWSIGIVVFGVLEFLVNRGEFETVWLAMWWAVQTVTTVGYGDVVPSNTAGKVVATILMIGGLSLYAVVTALITSVFVSRVRAPQQSNREDSLAAEVAKMSDQLAAVRDELARLRPRGD